MAANLTDSLKVRLDGPTRDALDTCADADGDKAAQVARRAIREYLQARGFLASPAGDYTPRRHRRHHP